MLTLIVLLPLLGFLLNGVLADSVALHDELRAAQLKVAAEIERARRIQTDLLPTSIPEVDGVAPEQRITWGARGGARHSIDANRRTRPTHGGPRRGCACAPHRAQETPTNCWNRDRAHDVRNVRRAMSTAGGGEGGDFHAGAAMA